MRFTALALSLWLIVSSTSPIAATSDSESTGMLSIVSDPAGAVAYVDGRVIGQTPIDVPRLTAGDHRVRLVKDGYLENGRIVTVARGKTQTVQVRMTAHPAADRASTEQVVAGGGGSNKKWIYIGVGRRRRGGGRGRSRGREFGTDGGRRQGLAEHRAAGQHQHSLQRTGHRQKQRSSLVHLGFRRWRHGYGPGHVAILRHGRNVHREGDGERRKGVGQQSGHCDHPQPGRNLAIQPGLLHAGWGASGNLAVGVHRDAGERRSDGNAPGVRRRTSARVAGNDQRIGGHELTGGDAPGERAVVAAADVRADPNTDVTTLTGRWVDSGRYRRRLHSRGSSRQAAEKRSLKSEVGSLKFEV